MKKRTHDPEAAPITFETFKKFGSYDVHNLTFDKPSAFNGRCLVRKFRVSVEMIEEPVEVIQQRIIQVWIENDNHHNCNAILDQANKYGLTYEDLLEAKNKAKE